MGPRPQQVLAERGYWGNPNPSHLIPPPSVFQTVSINKAINTQEVAVKEKHARNILPRVGHRTSKRGSWLGLLGKGPAARQHVGGLLGRLLGCLEGLDKTPRGSACWLGLSGMAPTIHPFSPGHLMGAVMGGMEG